MPRPMTITEKIIAAHADRAEVAPGENVWVSVDILMTHDVCGPGTIGIFKERFGPEAKVFDPERVIIIPDHYIFTADDKCHRNVQILRDFVREQGIRYYYDPDFVRGDGMPSPYGDPAKTSYRGVCHTTLAQEGHVRPGEILIGTDSHTCTSGAFGQLGTGVGNTDAAFTLGTGKTWLKVPPTIKLSFHGQAPAHVSAKDLILAVIGKLTVSGATYSTLYFAGEGIAQLAIEERMTLANMAIEAGGKNGVCDVDDKTLAYVRSRSNIDTWQVYEDDEAAQYQAEHEWDLEQMQPMVAMPHSPDNVDTAANCSNIKIDRAYIGSCTGGKITDMILAAATIGDQQVKVTTFVVPGTTEVHADMLRLNIHGQPRADGEKSVWQTFTDAGCEMGSASCAACLGGPSDTFGRVNEPLACISTTNRNFPGRMGHKQSGVYLASPLTVAASALTGRITDPRQFVTERIDTGSAGTM